MDIPDPVTTGLALAAALQLAKQGQDFIAAAAGHPGESLGTIVGNWTQRRVQNVEAVGNKAHLILLNIGIDQPAPVAMNILQPLLETASLQEDPGLQEIWANLLANAADPRHSSPVAPSFAKILGELTSREVKFLEALYLERFKPGAHVSYQYNSGDYFSEEDLRSTYSRAGLSRRPTIAFLTFGEFDQHGPELTADLADFTFSLNVIMRNNLLNERIVNTPIELRDILGSDTGGDIRGSIKVETASRFDFTELGGAFVKACRPPKGKENTGGGAS